MSVQDVVKQRILFNDKIGEDGKYHLYTLSSSKSKEEVYEERRKSMWQSYAWGVWCTARARESLQAGFDIVGTDNILYCDTDSIKYLGKADFSKYNEEQTKLCLKSGLYATDKQGVTHYAGCYEFDAFYSRFVSLGAKKYAYEDEHWQHYDDLSTRIHLTVSGVSKRVGARELALHGGLEAFKEGFIFENSGKTESKYNDESKPLVTKVDGNLVTITRNVVIRDVSYTLQYSDDYASCIEQSSNMLNRIHQFWYNLQLQ